MCNSAFVKQKLYKKLIIIYGDRSLEPSKHIKPLSNST